MSDERDNFAISGTVKSRSCPTLIDVSSGVLPYKRARLCKPQKERLMGFVSDHVYFHVNKILQLYRKSRVYYINITGTALNLISQLPSPIPHCASGEEFILTENLIASIFRTACLLTTVIFPMCWAWVFH